MEIDEVDEAVNNSGEVLCRNGRWKPNGARDELRNVVGGEKTRPKTSLSTCDGDDVDINIRGSITCIKLYFKEEVLLIIVDVRSRQVLKAGNSKRLDWTNGTEKLLRPHRSTIIVDDELIGKKKTDGKLLIVRRQECQQLVKPEPKMDPT